MSGCSRLSADPTHSGDLSASPGCRAKSDHGRIQATTKVMSIMIFGMCARFSFDLTRHGESHSFGRAPPPHALTISSPSASLPDIGTLGRVYT